VRTTWVVPDGVERVLHNVDAIAVLPGVIESLDYSKVFVISSRTLNTTTDVVDRLITSLGDRFVGFTDEVGDHAPVSNVIKGALAVRDSGAEVMVTIGGGSVIDFAKFIQLAISEDVYTKQELLERGKFGISADGMSIVGTSTAPPKIRQIAIPTSLATAEWNGMGTPVDDETRQKIDLMAVDGAPQVIIYDPSILALTPVKLILATGFRGLDHAINAVCNVAPHPLATTLAEKSVALYVENLPRIARDPHDREALVNCQLACWFVGMVLESVYSTWGFSGGSVIVLAPYAGVQHSDMACVMMLAQARWLDGLEEPPQRRITEILGRPNESFSVILEELLGELGLPTSLDELGVSNETIEEAIPLLLTAPFVTQHNLRPIKTADDLRAVLALVRR